MIETIPDALARLGSNCFAEMFAGKLEEGQARIVFVQPGLLKNNAGKPMSTEEARQFVEKHLLLKLEYQNQPDKESSCKKVFVDRQADPMQMSLNGNSGSGRAVYYGKIFNLKGIGKTVLATSSDKNHSNGHLDLVSALWEAICANVISSNLKTGSAPVLAVIDTGELIEVPWRTGKYPGGFIVRLDQNGELDRPTHLFFRNEPVNADFFRQFARDLGKQDAEKFIERILHGCWSAGNISIHGHMIDYDTVFALRSRAPQWSYRPNWLSNFFGLEGGGQKKLLKAMVNHHFNSEKIRCQEVYRIFDRSKKEHLELRFLDLIGLNPQQAANGLPISPKEYEQMVADFSELAMKMFPNFKATAPWNEENQDLAVFDFSRMFRFFPICFEQNFGNFETAMGLLRNYSKKFAESKVDGMTESIEKILRKNHTVSSIEQLQELETKARIFIEGYCRILDYFRKNDHELWQKMVLQAYRINEERTYMNCRPGNDTLVALVQHLQAGNLSAQQFSDRIQTIILACDRRQVKYLKNYFIADIKIFIEGFTANLLCEDLSFKPCLALFDRKVLANPAPDHWQITINGQKNECFLDKIDSLTLVIGPALPFSELLPARDSAETAFSLNGKRFQLSPIERIG